MSIDRVLPHHTDATNYIILLKEEKILSNSGYSEITSIEFIESLKKAQKHTFSSFLHTQPSFLKAKKKLISIGLMSDIDKITSPREGLAYISLEWSCAEAIKHCGHVFQSSAEGIAVAPKKWISEIKKKLNTLAAAYVFFELEAERQLFFNLLDKFVKHSSRNIFHSGKKHPNLIREFFIKYLLAALFNSIGQNLSDHDITVIATDITAIFFDPMDLSDASKLAKAIKQHEVKNLEFLQKKVIDILIAP